VARVCTPVAHASGPSARRQSRSGEAPGGGDSATGLAASRHHRQASQLKGAGSGSMSGAATGITGLAGPRTWCSSSLMSKMGASLHCRSRQPRSRCAAGAGTESIRSRWVARATLAIVGDDGGSPKARPVLFRFRNHLLLLCAYLTGDVSMFHHQRALLHKVALLLCGCVMAVWNSGDDCLSSCYCEGIYVPPTLVRLLPFVRRQPSLSTAGVSKGRV